MNFSDGDWKPPGHKSNAGAKHKMKLAQFKTRDADKQRLGVAVGDVVCDLAELAQAVKAAGGEPASWLLETNDTLSVIRRGESALSEINALFSDSQSRSSQGQAVGYPLDQIEFLPATYASK